MEQIITLIVLTATLSFVAGFTVCTLLTKKYLKQGVINKALWDNTSAMTNKLAAGL